MRARTKSLGRGPLRRGVGVREEGGQAGGLASALSLGTLGGGEEARTCCLASSWRVAASQHPQRCFCRPGALQLCCSTLAGIAHSSSPAAAPPLPSLRISSLFPLWTKPTRWSRSDWGIYTVCFLSGGSQFGL